MAQTSQVEQAGKRLVFEDTIEVPAPVDEVYRRWSDFTRFPEFMSNVEEVRKTGNNTYHWVARIFGIKEEWDAEVTDREPDRRLSWQSTSGAQNSGTVTFRALPDDKTEVSLRLEYTPPGGQVGETIDKLTQTTRREVTEDLKNFKRLMAGKKVSEQPSELEVPGEGAGRVLSSLLPPALGAAAGGVTAYFIEKNTRPTLSAKGFLGLPISQALGINRPSNPLAQDVVQPWSTASWVLSGLSATSVLSAAWLRLTGRKNDALFVGQWAPTFLGMGILSRLLGGRGITKVPGAITSWSLVGACLGAILTSAFWRTNGKRKDSLFIGQWAPTLLSAALFARLFQK